MHIVYTQYSNWKNKRKGTNKLQKNNRTLQ